MNLMTVNRKKVTKNAYRVTKVRGKTALRIRVPGGHIETKYFELIHNIADKYGIGEAHITARQGFEIPGIDFDKIPEIEISYDFNWLVTDIFVIRIRRSYVNIGHRDRWFIYT